MGRYAWCGSHKVRRPTHGLLVRGLGISLCVWASATLPPEAGAQTLYPVADNWINSCSSGYTANYGNDMELRVRTAALWGDIKNMRTLLQFDMSQVAVDTHLITGATLGLYLHTYHWDDPEGRTYHVHRVTNPWDELESNWPARDDYQSASPVYWDSYNAGVPAYRPGGGDFAPTVYASTVVPAVGNWTTWDVTDLVMEWLEGTRDNCGLLIKDADEFEAYPGYETISPLAQFRSTNYWDEALWPYLQVNYITLEFSLDTGSDTELSDPSTDGDEAFDPGDVYDWKGSPVVPPGRDGFKDDESIFASDPDPDPPDDGNPPATRVPVGSGSPQDYGDYFDLDGHDQIDVSIHDAQLIPEDTPLSEPIPQFESSCIFAARYLLISFDDDAAGGWPAGDVPVTALSPGGHTYGTTAATDEVLGAVVRLVEGPPPYALALQYPFADEITVHQSLAPNPDTAQVDDDDVDSLDIVQGRDACPVWLFTADHEGTNGLDAGDVYELAPGGAVRVIDDVIHLGLSNDTDVDAFELAWLRDPNHPGGMALAILFSVDDDDPQTPGVDESGGLDPNMVYYSFMTGSSQPLLAQPLSDDIDGFTLWRDQMENCAYPAADADGDGDVDLDDYELLETCASGPGASWSPTADGRVCTCLDQDNDGDVDQSDFGLFQRCLGGAGEPTDPKCAG